MPLLTPEWEQDQLKKDQLLEQLKLKLLLDPSKKPSREFAPPAPEAPPPAPAFPQEEESSDKQILKNYLQGIAKNREAEEAARSKQSEQDLVQNLIGSFNTLGQAVIGRKADNKFVDQNIESNRQKLNEYLKSRAGQPLEQANVALEASKLGIKKPKETKWKEMTIPVEGRDDVLLKIRYDEDNSSRREALDYVPNPYYKKDTPGISPALEFQKENQSQKSHKDLVNDLRKMQLSQFQTQTLSSIQARMRS
jgi:hypothetical protein